VLVVDDHPMFRAGLVSLVEELPWASVAGEAADGRAALDLVRETEPDVVLMDLQMPVMNGLAATRAITTELPSVAVMVMTMVENDEAVASALRAGARGYLVKGSSRDEIARGIEAVAAGEVLLGAGVGASVLARLTSANDGLVPFPQLSDREREVLDLLARGLDNASIAGRLYLSEKTVRNVVSTVFTKLEVPSRAAAVAAARDAGLGGAELAP
jgi:DNA-binding NarL/FixJ family response regulator